MDSSKLIDGLIQYLGLVVMLTFHEVGHAWMAWKCGDDTAKRQGRISLNPIVHMDFVGTVVLPLLMIFLSGTAVASFMVGWAKPVPVNPHNLRNPRLDDILVAVAGPWMNLILAVLLMAVARGGREFHYDGMVQVCFTMAQLNLALCFFNMLPIPPLDGSHVVRSLLGISYEAYWKVARYGFILVIVVLQIPAVRQLLSSVTAQSFVIMARWFGVRLWAE
jgi:Zn-dependent protease